ncbi:unnamed protein product [Effrenium voratum]|nr:unnamed protein product [Effrenium voratum]
MEEPQGSAPPMQVEDLVSSMPKTAQEPEEVGSGYGCSGQDRAGGVELAKALAQEVTQQAAGTPKSDACIMEEPQSSAPPMQVEDLVSSMPKTAQEPEEVGSGYGGSGQDRAGGVELAKALAQEVTQQAAGTPKSDACIMEEPQGSAPPMQVEDLVSSMPKTAQEPEEVGSGYGGSGQDRAGGVELAKALAQEVTQQAAGAPKSDACIMEDEDLMAKALPSMLSAQAGASSGSGTVQEHEEVDSGHSDPAHAEIVASVLSPMVLAAAGEEEPAASASMGEPVAVAEAKAAVQNLRNSEGT